MWKNINSIPIYTRIKTRYVKSLDVKSKTLELPKLKIRRLYLQGRKTVPKQNPKNNTIKENTDNFNYIKTSVKLKIP